MASIYRRRRRRSRLWVPVAVGVVGLALVGGSIAGIMFLLDYIPGLRHESVFTYHPSLSRSGINIILNDEILTGYDTSPPVIQDDGQVLLPVDFIMEHLEPDGSPGQRTFWDQGPNVIITTYTQVRRFTVGQLEYTNNDTPATLEEPFTLINNMVYVPQAFAEREYNIRLSFYEDYLIVAVDDAGEEALHAAAIEDTRLRGRPESRSPYMYEIPMGDTLRLLDIEDGGDFWRVRAQNGIMGYVEAEHLGQPVSTAAITPEPEPSLLYRKPPLQYPIIMLWDILHNHANRGAWSVADEVTVMSPTWFSFLEGYEDQGIIRDVGNREYVDYAHANGRQVWALITDNFSSAVAHAVLANTDVRRFVVEQLIELAEYYNLDGINIDYEAVTPPDAPYFIQFLRELRPPLHERGVWLSAALFVPRYTRFMNRTEIAQAVDYIQVMTYDEHWSGSPNTGPVASLSFVQEGIVETMSEMPASMIMMGLPFYNRIWREVTEPDGSTHHTIRNMGMNYTRNFFEQGGATFTWLPEVGSYFAEFPDPADPNAVFRVWLEDARSIGAKLEMARQYNLPGVAAWRGGLESAQTWDVIADYIEAFNAGGP